MAPEADPESILLSRYGGRSAVWIPEDSWFDSAPGAGNYAPRAPRPALETTQPSIESAMGIFSPAAKRPQRVADNLPSLLPILMVEAILTATPRPNAFTECKGAELLLSQLLYITVKDRVPNP